MGECMCKQVQQWFLWLGAKFKVVQPIFEVFNITEYISNRSSKYNSSHKFRNGKQQISKWFLLKKFACTFMKFSKIYLEHIYNYYI